MIYLVDLGTYVYLRVTEELKMELEVLCDLSPAVCVCVSECNYSALLVPLNSEVGFLLPLIYPFYMGQGY